jgi:predicted RNA-binding Zn-ribbon protein involved in translation (DUF1610 family)
MESRLVSIRDVHALVLRTIRDARAENPEIEARDAVARVLDRLSIHCPTCGEYTRHRAAAIVMAGSGVLNDDLLRTPALRSISLGLCPDCSGTEVIVRFGWCVANRLNSTIENGARDSSRS